MKTATCLLLFILAIPAATHQGDISTDQWDAYFAAEVESTKAAVQACKDELEAVRNQQRQLQRNREVRHEEKRRQIELLKERKAMLETELREYRESARHGRVIVAEKIKVGRIGSLATTESGRPMVFQLLDDNNALIHWVTLLHLPGEIREVKAGPYWLTNAHASVETAGGTYPSLDGLFVVGSAKSYVTTEGVKVRVPHLKAIRVDLDAERARWADRLQQAKRAR